MLYHCQYFQHVAVSASNCYQGRNTFPLQAHADTISGPDPHVVNLFGKPFFKSYYIWQDLWMLVYTFCVYGNIDSENSLWFWRSDPQASTGNSRRPSSSLSTSSTVVSHSPTLRHRLSDNETIKSNLSFVFCCQSQVKDSVLLTPLQGPSAVSVTEDTPAKRLMAQGRLLWRTQCARFLKAWPF